MTKQEFEELAGYEVTDEVFNEINAIYMVSADLCKDDFVKSWRGDGKAIIYALMDQIGSMDADIDNLKALAENRKRNMEMNAELLLTIIDKGYEENDELDMMAANMAGRDYCIRKRLALGYKLSEGDTERLAELLDEAKKK